MGGNLMRLQVTGYRLRVGVAFELAELATTYTLQTKTRVTESRL